MLAEFVMGGEDDRDVIATLPVALICGRLFVLRCCCDVNRDEFNSDIDG